MLHQHMMSYERHSRAHIDSIEANRIVSNEPIVDNRIIPASKMKEFMISVQRKNEIYYMYIYIYDGMMSRRQLPFHFIPLKYISTSIRLTKIVLSTNKRFMPFCSGIVKFE